MQTAKIMLSMMRDCRGAVAIEYVLIAVVISIGIIAGALGIGLQLNTIMEVAGNGVAP